jgi:hypothetical protein
VHQNAVPDWELLYVVPNTTFYDPDVGDSLACVAQVWLRPAMSHALLPGSDGRE